MNKKAIIIVLDSVGIGELPDAANYGDKGADTLGHIINTCHPKLPHLMELGLANIDGASFPGRVDAPKGCFGKLREVSAGKDTTTGHWEIAGVQLAQAFPTFPNGFPQDFIERFEKAVGRGTLGNKPASGTAILLVENWSWRTAGLLALGVWGFCRAYYFAFYVIERWVDPKFKFSGLGHFLAYAWRRMRNR